MGCINTAIDFAFDSADYVYERNKNETILRSGIKTDPVIGTNILNENNVDNNSTVSYSEQPNSEYINDKLYGINTDNLNIDTDFDTKPKACRACVDVMNENKAGNTSNPEQFIQSNQPDGSMSLNSLVGNNNNPEADIDSDSKFHTGATVGVMNENNAGNISNPEQFIQSIQSNQPDSDSEFHTGVTVGKIGNVGHVGNTNNSNNRNSNDNINSNNNNSNNCLLPVCSMDIATDFNGYVYENNNNINMDSDSGTGIIIENNVVNIASEQRNSELVNDDTDNDTDIKPSSTGMSFVNENNPGSTACSFSTNLDINCKAGIGDIVDFVDKVHIVDGVSSANSRDLVDIATDLADPVSDKIDIEIDPDFSIGTGISDVGDVGNYTANPKCIYSIKFEHDILNIGKTINRNGNSENIVSNANATVDVNIIANDIYDRLPIDTTLVPTNNCCADVASVKVDVGVNSEYGGIDTFP